jgi:hypothetical protein
MVTAVGAGVCDAVAAAGSTSAVATRVTSTTYTLLSLKISPPANGRPMVLS